MRETIDGVLFGQMMVHAAASIQAQRQKINELNVFPVPDGDTGTNMSLTMGAAATEFKKGAAHSVGQVAALAASALLRGARGNSGVILSLLFRGFSKVLKDKEEIDGADFALALDAGVSAAYKAVMNPTEGTILTVSRAMSRCAAETAQENAAVEYVLRQVIEEGERAVAETIHQNPVLEKAGVVDAGGKGFVIILRGMLDSLLGLPMPEAQEETEKEAADFDSFSTEDIRFGYCTEFICSRDTKRDPELLRGFLAELGDSLVLVDDAEIIKVHVHTNNPGKVLEEALRYGALLTVKIENMREQHTAIVSDSSNAEGEYMPVAPEKQYGIVAVCAGDGLAEIFRDLGADRIISGGQTMNPSTEDILMEVNRTPAEIVYILPNNKNIIMAAEQAAEILVGKRAVVLPTTTVPQGISALLNFDPDCDVAQNKETMMRAAKNVCTMQITYAARDSDFDGFSIKEGDYLALEESQIFGIDVNLGSLLLKISESCAEKRAQFITIYYGETVTESEGKETLALFQKHCPDVEVSLVAGGQPVYYYMIAVETE